MSFYFVWVRPDEPFNPVLHRRQDEHILHFDIDHQEGSVPLLRLSLSEAHHAGKEIGDRGILWQQEGQTPHVLFDGVVSVSLSEKKGGFLLLVLEGGSLDNEKRLEAHLEAVLAGKTGKGHDLVLGEVDEPLDLDVHPRPVQRRLGQVVDERGHDAAVAPVEGTEGVTSPMPMIKPPRSVSGND